MCDHVCLCACVTVLVNVSSFSWYLQIKGLAGTALRMWIIPKSAKVTSLPQSPFTNLELVPGSKLCAERFQATVLLENPVGENVLSYQQLQLEVRGSHVIVM